MRTKPVSYKKSKAAIFKVVSAIQNFTNPWRVPDKNRLHSLASGSPLNIDIENNVLNSSIKSILVQSCTLLLLLLLWSKNIPCRYSWLCWQGCWSRGFWRNGCWLGWLLRWWKWWIWTAAKTVAWFSFQKLFRVNLYCPTDIFVVMFLWYLDFETDTIWWTQFYLSISLLLLISEFNFL